MGRARIGIFKQIGKRKMGTVEAHNDLCTARQTSGMTLYQLMKTMDRANLLIYRGNPTDLDDMIMDKLREAARLVMESEKLIVWCCNASELDDENKEDDG